MCLLFLFMKSSTNDLARTTALYAVRAPQGSKDPSSNDTLSGSVIRLSTSFTDKYSAYLLIKKLKEKNVILYKKTIILINNLKHTFFTNFTLRTSYF